MNKKFTFSVVALMISWGVSAAPISPEQALQRLSGNSDGPLRAKTTMSYSKTIEMENGMAAAYIFVPEDGRGFAILSADDLAIPLLGYSDNGKIDVNNLPPSFVWWMTEMGKKAEYVAKNCSDSDIRVYAPDGMTEIPPMLSTRWNQDAPYNDNTPIVSGVQSPTGCVATSFAQVMKYFNYPDKGKGTLNYTNNGQTLTLQLTRQKFDWDNMINDYGTQEYTPEQAAAVAYLMQACGYGVEMNYGASSSGAQSYKIVNAAIDHFKYDVGMHYEERKYFSPVTWTQMVYDNLKNVGPVIYDGTSLTGGHSFVCDGYDGNGYFHFNWGWGGISDGYYLLDTLNPETQGIGGAEGGFSFSQGIILGMQEPVEGSVRDTTDKMQIYGSLVASYENGYLLFTAADANPTGWGNGSWHSINVVLGAIISNAETGEVIDNVEGELCSPGSYSGIQKISLDIYRYYPTTSVNPVVQLPANLPDGRYKVTMATRSYSNEEDPWVPMVCEWGYSNYCYITVSNGNVSVENVNVKRLTFEDAIIDSPLYVGKNFKLSATVKNTSDIPLSMCYYPALLRDGVVQYQGDYMLVSAEPGEIIEIGSPVFLYTANGATNTGTGTYILQIYDKESGHLVASFGEYDMTYSYGSLNVVLDDLSIQGATVQDHKVGNRTFKDVYVSDNKDVVVNFIYTVKQGYLDKSVNIIVNEYNPTNGAWNLWDNNLYYNLPFAGAGETRTVEVEHDFSGNNLATIYRIRAYYSDSRGQNSLGYILLGFDSNLGVESVVDENEIHDYEYYNLQGIRVLNPQKGQLLIRKSGRESKKIIFR